MEVVRKKRSLLHHAMMNLPFMILTFVWVIVGFPLPLYYMGFFILKVIQICLLPMEKIDVYKRQVYLLPMQCLAAAKISTAWKAICC